MTAPRRDPRLLKALQADAGQPADVNLPSQAFMDKNAGHVHMAKDPLATAESPAKAAACRAKPSAYTP